MISSVLEYTNTDLVSEFLYVTVASKEAITYVRQMTTDEVSEVCAWSWGAEEYTDGKVFNGTANNKLLSITDVHTEMGSTEQLCKVARLKIELSNNQGRLLFSTGIKPDYTQTDISATIHDGNGTDEYADPKGDRYAADMAFVDPPGEVEIILPTALNEGSDDIRVPRSVSGWPLVKNEGTGKGLAEICDGDIPLWVTDVHALESDLNVTDALPDGGILVAADGADVMISSHVTGIRRLTASVTVKLKGGFVNGESDYKTGEVATREITLRQIRGVSEVVLVLDKSGSMLTTDEGSQHSRWHLVTAAANTVLQAAFPSSPDDAPGNYSVSRAFVVTFANNNAEVVGGGNHWSQPLTGTPGFGLPPVPTHNTPIGRGMEVARSLFQPHVELPAGAPNPAEVNRRFMLVFTDGNHNGGAPAPADVGLLGYGITLVPLIWGLDVNQDAWGELDKYQVPGGSMAMEDHYIVDVLVSILAG